MEVIAFRNWKIIVIDLIMTLLFGGCVTIWVLRYLDEIFFLVLLILIVVFYGVNFLVHISSPRKLIQSDKTKLILSFPFFRKKEILISDIKALDIMYYKKNHNDQAPGKLAIQTKRKEIYIIRNILNVNQVKETIKCLMDKEK